MELLSPGMMVAALPDPLSLAPAVNGILESFLHPTFAYLALILSGQIIWIVGSWIASKIVAEADAATFINALKMWLFGLLCLAIVVASVSIALPYVAASGDSWRIWLVVCGAAMLSLLAVFLVPMKVYGIDFGRALVIVLLAGILQTAVVTGLQFTVLKGAIPENQFAAMQGLIGKVSFGQSSAAKPDVDRAASNEIDQLLTIALHPVGPPPSLPEHEAMVQTLQQKLQSRKNTLPPNNAREALVFQNQLNRYLYFLEIVKAERRIHPPTSAPVRTVTSSPAAPPR